MSDAIGFYFFAALIVGAAALMLRSTHIVHSAFFLFGALLATAGIYALLDAGFLAMMQIFIYAGAITVLILFVIMLTGAGISDIGQRSTNTSIAAAVALALAGILVPLQVNAGWRLSVATAVVHTDALGEKLFEQYLLPFELASIVLLVALVGATFLALEEE